MATPVCCDAPWCSIGLARTYVTDMQSAKEDGMKAFSDYGPTMQKFLLRAFNEGVAPDDPIATHLISKTRGTRAQALERAGLIEKRQSKKGRLSWRLTDVGRGLVMAHQPVFLHRRGFPSYTSKPWQAMFSEPEVIQRAA